MGNKKVYLGSAILLLAAAAIGAGLWLQHRAEQKREEKLNAVYGYWITEDPNSAPWLCIAIDQEKVVFSNWWSHDKSTSVPEVSTGEPIVAMNAEGRVTAEAGNRHIGKEKAIFTLNNNDYSRMSLKFPGDKPLALKRITEKEYYEYWRPLDVGPNGGKTHYFIDPATTPGTPPQTLVGIRFLNERECLFLLFEPRREKQVCLGKFPIVTCQRAGIIVAPEQGRSFQFDVLGATIRISNRILYPVPDSTPAGKKLRAVYDALLDKQLAKS